MESLILDILEELRHTGQVDDKSLAKIIHRHNKGRSKDETAYSKKRILPFYLRIKESNPERWEAWNIDEELENKLVATLQMKPRRTASGVATITVITKPWKCSSNCIYCPNDLRMPKSYLSDEPACQRAERNFFDPYLQVVSRLRALTHMGHVTDKIELIVLGGTWNDYSEGYQMWFIKELFRALNDDSNAEEEATKRRKSYKQKGLSNREEDLSNNVSVLQEKINRGSLSYNQALDMLYDNSAWLEVFKDQRSDMDEVLNQQSINEMAAHRVVGLVIETRPDSIDVPQLTLLRKLGCTKIQMGIQSLNPSILKANKRRIGLAQIQEAFALLRLFGFKIHAHFMINLYGSTPQKDIEDYRVFVTDEHYLPDEVKLYPCVLVAGTELCEHHADKTWVAYSEEELIDVLIADTLITPPYVRISRMIRDISAHDIIAGNKKANLRQLIEQKIEKSEGIISEIRHREISTSEICLDDFHLEILPYKTSVSNEFFLQWIDDNNRIAGFLRLSLPDFRYLQTHGKSLPIRLGEAMIREVHVYGKVTELHKAGEDAQHVGLGKQLIETACTIAREHSYTKIQVISSVGTREYYRGLGFEDGDLYQFKSL